MIRGFVTALALFFSLAVNTTVAFAQDLPPVDTLEQELAACRKDDIDTSTKFLQPALPPYSENAAPIYTQIGALLAQRKSYDDKLSTYTGSEGAPPSSTDIVQLQSLINNNADLLVLIHEAVSRPKCVYQRDMSHGPIGTLFPEFKAMRRSCDWLEAEALVKAAGGDGVGATDDMAQGFVISSQITSDLNVMISSLNVIAVDNVTLSGLNKIMDLTQGDPSVAKEVQRLIGSEFTAPDLKPAVNGEIVFITNSTYGQLLTSGEITATQVTQLMKEFSGATESQLGPSAYFEYCKAALVSRLHVLYAVCNSNKDEIDQYNSSVAADSHSDPNRFLEAFFMPIYKDWPIVRLRTIGLARMVRVTAELLQYKAEFGNFPYTLDQLSGPPAPDPMGYGPLNYRLNSGGFVLYGVGKDRTNDGTGPADPLSQERPTISWPVTPSN